MKQNITLKNSGFLSKQQIILLLCAVSFNFLVYNGGRFLGSPRVHYCLTTKIDEAIPLLPWTTLIYWGCYLFWVINYCLSVKYEKGRNGQFIVSHFIGEIVCFLTFVFVPTTMVRPEVTGASIFDKLLSFTYLIDRADNLLPSIHCFVSWLCWIGIRGNEKIPKWYRIFSFFFALSVCISTLTVKQHVIADVFAGTILAEISFLLAKKIWR